MVLVVVGAACGGASEGVRTSLAVPSGLAAGDEVPLIETGPDPSDASFLWSRAYELGGLGPINVGRPTPEFMADAHRDAEEAEELVCIGSGDSAGCAASRSPRPELIGLTFGGSDVLAWAWIGVPDPAVAVRFTDQDGTATWQKPADGLVIFPDPTDGDPDGICRCRFDAIDADGAVIVSVDLQAGRYING